MRLPKAPPLSNMWLSKYEPNKRDSVKLFESWMDDIVRTIKVDLIETNLLKQIHYIPNLSLH